MSLTIILNLICQSLEDCYIVTDTDHRTIRSYEMNVEMKIVEMKSYIIYVHASHIIQNRPSICSVFLNRDRSSDFKTCRNVIEFDPKDLHHHHRCIVPALLISTYFQL